MADSTHKAEVLVIDDSDLTRDFMASLLEDQGFRVATLPSAIGATSLIASSSISVVVTDVNMPKLPGNNLVKLLRDNPRCSHVKIVLVSGLEHEELQALCRQVEADSIVEKSRLEDDLVSVVRRLHKRPISNRAP